MTIWVGIISVMKQVKWLTNMVVSFKRFLKVERKRTLEKNLSLNFLREPISLANSSQNSLLKKLVK